jgi:multisubunit Na+/H+ antiporter MnhC subunit
LIIGIVLVLLGVLVLINPNLLAIVVGLALILGGMWVALQNAPAGGSI